MPIDVATVRGVAECALSSEVLAALPAQAPPAPWTVHARGLFWWSKPDQNAQRVLREVLPGALGAELTPVFVMGALISYDRTPVGPYHEVIGIVSARRGRRVVTHVPFIAVDSAASVVAGRANWALPKTLVDFDGEPHCDSTMSVHGAGWRIQARPRARGPRLPFASPPLAALTQVGGDDGVWRLRGSGYGSVRLARVEVEVSSGGSLAEWLPSGHCQGALSTSMTGRMGPARAPH